MIDEEENAKEKHEQGKWEREVEEQQVLWEEQTLVLPKDRARANALIAKLAFGKTNVCFPERQHPKLTKKQVREIMKQLKGMGGMDS